MIDKNLIIESNKNFLKDLDKDFDYFIERISRLKIDYNQLKEKISLFTIALPSWGLGSGGTRFAKFRSEGEPRNIFEKIEDCSVVNDLVGITPLVSLHFPWDDVNDLEGLLQHAKNFNLKFDIINSNTFQDFDNNNYSYKFGSLTHSQESIRQKAIELNIDCIKKGITLGAKGLVVWLADGTNFPGQQNFSTNLNRYINSMQKIYSELPDDWIILLEHKPYEPAFYSTVINDWGTSYICSKELGEKAMCLVDLGHHLPNTNIEMIISRLINLNKLGGFHFNDSKYGDDDLDSGSINPYELFLIFNELSYANSENIKKIHYMIDQTHNITDPIESLIQSSNEIINAYAKSLLIDQAKLKYMQENNDVIGATMILKEAYGIDVSPLIKKIRFEKNNSIEPLINYRELNYKKQKAKIRIKKIKTSNAFND